MSLDINKLLDEVEADVKRLLKSAQDDAASLKKAEDEESKKEESKKEESKKEESKKEESKMEKADEEGSGYETQAPEASAEAEQQPEADMQQDQPAQEENMEDISQIVQGLDDDMLHELYQKIKMELMGRMNNKGDQAPEMSQEAQAPEMSQDAQPSPDLAMKSEKETFEKLSKAETDLKNKDEEINKLKKSVEDYEKGLSEMTDMLKTVLEKPVQRALTDITFVAKEEGLKKSEGLTDEEIKKAVDSISSDRKKLQTLAKGEFDVIQDFYAGKNVKDKVIKLINK